MDETRARGEGMAAGAIAETLGVRQNTMSTNLSLLQAAGLVRGIGAGRSIRYLADMAGMRALLAFLMEDCCRGRPELCRPVLDELVCKERDDERPPTTPCFSAPATRSGR